MILNLRTTLKILILLIWSLATVSTNAQDYNYIHYTTKDGLAGNTVYDVSQEKDGYMFFATENGLSRFDGKEWKTFTVKDGLPDNEVLSIYCDKLNRLWIFTFNNKVCYLKDGKFYTEQNDPLVKNIKLIQPIQNVFETADGKIFFVGNYNLFLIEKNFVKSLWCPSSVNSNLNYTEIPSADKKNRFYIDDTIFYLKNQELVFEKINPDYSKEKKVDFSNRKMKLFKNAVLDTSNLLATYKKYYLNQYWDNYIPTNEGCLYFTRNSNCVYIYLPNKKIGHHFLDLEGNHWFTTMGEGVYKLGSSAFYSYTIADKKNNINREIFSISKFRNQISFGSSYGKLGCMSTEKKISLKDYQDYTKFSLSTDNINRLVSLFRMDSSLILGFDNLLGRVQKNKLIFHPEIRPNKSIERVDNCLLVATGKGVFKVSPLNLQVIDTLFPQRSTYANYLNHQYYIGTTNGLFIVNESKQQSYLGNIHPALKRRVTCIKNFNNKVYVATADAGIVVLYNNKVVAAINDSMGLSSNSVKTLHISGTTLWVGTIKGVNKIDLNTNKVITKYSTSDGLPSDIINAIYYDNTDSTVWVGSTEGLTYFKEKDILGQSMCNLVMENITVSKTNINRDSNNLSLKYNDNIQFQFVGISLRSGDEILYHYKLQGLDANFNTTTERFLSYPSLPSGNYTLQLYATNKFGVKSKTYTCTFTVAPPFWKTWWFYTLELSVFAFIIWIILYTRFKRKQKEYKLNADFKVLLADMEQQALQAQMNPHFIFNSLNSIQQFMLQNDKQQANKYLTSFATLIRKTLDYSAKKSISLTDEIDYLNQYVALELLRFNNSFTCTINVSDDLEVDLIKIPALLLQPFVENAIRHGIRNKTSNDGVLLIDFKMLDDNLICTVEDNGIGRKKAQEIKSTTHIEYQSKGLDITQKRITLLNTKPDNKFDIQIIDLMNDNVAIGTRVVVTIAV